MLSRRVLSSNYPKFTKIWPFLFISHACPAFQKNALRSQKLYPISFNGFFLTNMIDNYLFSVLNYLLDFVLLVIFVTENRSNMNLPSSVSYCILYSVPFFSITRPSKAGILPSIFFPFRDFDSLLNRYTISLILYSTVLCFLENRLIISWLAFAWSLKHLLLSEFTFVNQASASSSKSPSWKSNKTRNIQNKIKCLFQLLC